MRSVTFTDKNTFQQAFANFGEVTPNLKHGIGALLSNQDITVECPAIDPEHGLWDGLMFVKFKRVPPASQVVNILVQPSRADEVSMEDEKTLRLWWD